MSPGIERLEAVIGGRVQGVGFRWFVIRLAGEMGVVGWVANEADGSVRCVAEGRREVLERFLVALREGPPGAHVDGVSESWSAAAGRFAGFTVRAAGHRGD